MTTEQQLNMVHGMSLGDSLWVMAEWALTLTFQP